MDPNGGGGDCTTKGNGREQSPRAALTSYLSKIKIARSPNRGKLRLVADPESSPRNVFERLSMTRESSAGNLRASRQRSPPVDKSVLSEIASIRDRLNDLSSRVAGE